MEISDSQMDNLVANWAKQAAVRPDTIKPRQLLQGRDLRMYRALGKESADELARFLVEHRSIAALEISMGGLYEAFFETLGSERVSASQRTEEGYRGIDFLRETGATLELISFRGGMTAFGGDFGGVTIRNWDNARQYWVNKLAGSDAGRFGKVKKVVMVRAVARGPQKREERENGIVWLVGDEMWKYYGAGERFLSRVSSALGRTPLNIRDFDAAKARAADRVVAYLNRSGLVQNDGTVKWEQLSDVYN